MVYVVPQVQVFQDFNITPQALTAPLAAHISGGHARLIRYGEADEKQDGSLGQYSHSLDVAFPWPDRPAGAIVDRDYTKLFIDDALLHYWNSADGDNGDSLTSVVGYPNRVAASSLNFSTNGAYAHDDAFLDRGVKVGDAVRIRATVDDEQLELCTYVSGFVADTVAATTGSVSAGDGNADATSADVDAYKLDGAVNCVTIGIHNTSTYHGLLGGQPDETYTVRVLQGSVDGDATSAILRVTSESGTDDVLELSPAAFGSPTSVGTRGVKIVWDLIADSLSDCDEDAETEGVSPHDFVEGQEWRIVVSQAYTLPTLTMGGTYTGTQDDTYIIEVYRGRAADGTKPQFTVRTTKGGDLGTPITVTATGTYYAVGIKGLTVSFNSTSLNKGDRWYVPVQASTEGARKTLTLGHSLPTEILDNGATALIADLYIRKNIEVAANREGFAPDTNWDQSDTEITVNSGILAYDASYTDSGVPVALEVHGRCEYSNMFVQIRYWLCTLGGIVTEIASSTDLEELVSGSTHPDNPLKYAALKALQNSNGIGVRVTAVCDPSDVDEWAAVLETIDGRDGVYGLVPLTKDPAVWSLFQAHVEAQSSPATGHWRVLWLNAEGVPTKSLVGPDTSSDGELVMAVVEDDPLTSGTQYTQLRVPATNAKFSTNGLRAGDIVRFVYSSDGFGGETYSEFVIDAVVNEDLLRLQNGLDTPISVAERMEVWRTLNAAEQAAEIALTGGFTDRRVRYVWPDTIQADGRTVQGYFLCAALAGLCSGVVPHQGLTRLEISGFTSTPRSNNSFGYSQLNTMAGSGVWIVFTDESTGTILTRHAVTTGNPEDIEQYEEGVTRNVDSMSFQFLRTLSPYIGVSNVTESLIDLLKSELNGKIRELTSSNYVANLGPQLTSGVINELRPHAVLRDRVVARINLEIPFNLNNIDCHLVVVA